MLYYEFKSLNFYTRAYQCFFFTTFVVLQLLYKLIFAIFPANKYSALQKSTFKDWDS